MTPRHSIEITFINRSGRGREPMTLHFGDGYAESTIQRFANDLLMADEIKSVAVTYARQCAS
jgi:hypothetical protein